MKNNESTAMTVAEATSNNMGFVNTDALALLQDTQQEMLRAHIVLPQIARFLGALLEHLFCARRV